MSFDSIFEEVGENGRYQLLYVIFIALGKMVAPIQIMAPIFTAYDRKFHCSSWGNASTVSNMCKSPSGNESAQICPEDKWVFDTSIFLTTLQSKYLLICNHSFMAPIATTMFMIGFAIGCTLYGYLGDRFGRVKIITVTGFHGLIIGFVTPFAPNIWLYYIGRILNGIGCGGFLAVVNITLSEMTTTKYRVNYVLLGQVIWAIGDLVLILISYLQRDQVYLEVIASLFFIFPLSAIFVLPECPRWLACQGHFDEAFKVMQRFGNISREKYDELIIPIMAEIKAGKELDAGTKFDFLRLPNMRRTTFLLWFVFVSTSFLTYAFAFSSAKFAGNPHVSKLIMTLPNVLDVATFFCVAHKLDRVPVISLSFFIGSFCCCLLAPMSLDKASYGIAILVIATAAYLIFKIVFSIIWLYVVEVYPTELRNTSVGCTSTWARVGSILSPQVIQIERIWTPLPFIVYSILAFVAAIIGLGLPETRGVVTLDSIVDGERFAGGPNGMRKCFSYCLRKPSNAESSSLNKEEECMPMNEVDKVEENEKVC